MGADPATITTRHPHFCGAVDSSAHPKCGDLFGLLDELDMDLFGDVDTSLGQDTEDNARGSSGKTEEEDSIPTTSSPDMGSTSVELDTDNDMTLNNMQVDGFIQYLEGVSNLQDQYSSPHVLVGSEAKHCVNYDGSLKQLQGSNSFQLGDQELHSHLMDSFCGCFVAKEKNTSSQTRQNCFIQVNSSQMFIHNDYDFALAKQNVNMQTMLHTFSPNSPDYDDKPTWSSDCGSQDTELIPKVLLKDPKVLFEVLLDESSSETSPDHLFSESFKCNSDATGFTKIPSQQYEENLIEDVLEELGLSSPERGLSASMRPASKLQKSNISLSRETPFPQSTDIGGYSFNDSISLSTESFNSWEKYFDSLHVI